MGIRLAYRVSSVCGVVPGVALGLSKEGEDAPTLLDLDLLVNRAYQLFPENDTPASDQSHRLEAEQRAFAQATRGVHW